MWWNVAHDFLQFFLVVAGLCMFNTYKPVCLVALLQLVIHFCFCSEVHGHRHRVWMHSCQHSVSHRQEWMGGDQVSAST